jgi:hypothetical protein
MGCEDVDWNEYGNKLLNMAVFWVTLMMEAARTSETLVNFYQTTRRNNPEDSHLRTHRRENLKSYLINFWFHKSGKFLE